MCFVKGEYLDGDELAITLSILALPAVILGVASLLIARHKINEPALGVDETAATRCGISIGLGIGAIVCALVGIIIAGLDFAII